MADNKSISEIYSQHPLASPSGDEIALLYNPSDTTASYAATLQSIRDYIAASIPSGGGGGGDASSFTITVGTADSGADYETDGTDDHVQIQAALDFADTLDRSARVEILPGVYNCAATLEMYTGTVLVGHGRYATFLDFSEWESGSVPILINGDSGGNDYTIRDIGFKGYFTHGIDTQYAANGQIGIVMADAQRVEIANCYFENFYVATGLGSATSSPYHDTAGALNIKDIILTNNYVYDCAGGLQGRAQNNIIWDSNVFRDIADDCMAFLAAEDNAPHCKNAVAIGNIFENGRPENDNGVLGVGTLFKLDGGGTGPETIDNLIIAGNVADNAEIGIYLANGRNVHVDNNVINTTNRGGIYLIGGNDKHYITNNTVIDANTSSNGSHAGIFAVTVDDLTIRGNHVYGQTTGGKQGIDVEGTCVDVIISDNHVESVSFFGIYAETCNNLSVHGNLLTGSLAGGIRIGGTNVSLDNNSFFGTYSGSKLALGTVAGVHIGFNNGLNPKWSYAQGNVTGATTFNRENGDVITATLTGNITVTLTNPWVKGSELTLILTQDGTGSRTVSWPAGFDRKNGGTLNLSTTAAAVDVVRMVWDGSSWHEVSRAIEDLSFVDTASAQTNIGGAKTFTGAVTVGGLMSVFNKLVSTQTTNVFDIQPATGSFIRFLNKSGNLAGALLAGEGSTLSLYNTSSDGNKLLTGYTTTDSTTTAFSFADTGVFTQNFAINFPITSLTANTVLSAAHHVIEADMSGASRTFTLPPVSGITGRIYGLIKTDTSVNTATLDGDGSETINGAASYVVSTPGHGVFVMATSSGWRIVHLMRPEYTYAQGNVTGATTFNAANGTQITATLTDNITVTLTAGTVIGQRLTLKLIQDGTGSRTATWPSNFKKVGGTLTLTTTASAVDVITMQYDGTNWNETGRNLELS